MKRLFTLALVRNPTNGDILLGLKKRGLGERKWNGFGGKVEPGESIMSAAARELQEECGLQAKCMTQVGWVNFEFVNDPVVREMHIFSTEDYVGEVIETEEMRPQWYKVTDIPMNKVWQDMSVWIPWYLRGDNFKASFLYDNSENILRYDIIATP